VLLVASSLLGGDTKPSVKSLGESLTCQCGCGQTVTGCNHYECASRTEMQASIQKEIAAGKAEATILQDFVLRYGVKVLSTPPARGFNSLVWILPGVGLVAGLAVLMAITRRWRKPVTEARGAVPASIDPKLLGAVEEEMKSSKVGVQD
jgi:cytochrome c-type biogenesis protein CcmH/NrfF